MADDSEQTPKAKPSRLESLAAQAIMRPEWAAKQNPFAQPPVVKDKTHFRKQYLEQIAKQKSQSQPQDDVVMGNTGAAATPGNGRKKQKPNPKTPGPKQGPHPNTTVHPTPPTDERSSKRRKLDLFAPMTPEDWTKAMERKAADSSTPQTPAPSLAQSSAMANGDTKRFPFAAAHSPDVIMSGASPATAAANSVSRSTSTSRLKRIVRKWEDDCNAESQEVLQAALDSLDGRDAKSVAASAKQIGDVLTVVSNVRRQGFREWEQSHQRLKARHKGMGTREGDAMLLKLQKELKQLGQDLQDLDKTAKGGKEEQGS